MNIKSVHFFSGRCFLFACSSKDSLNTIPSINDMNVSIKEGATKVVGVSFENTRWKSTDDPKSVLEVKNGKWNSFYDGKKLSIGDYKFQKESEGSLLTINENGEVYKYNIIIHMDTELQMTMIGGRGNTVTYEKY